MMANPGDQAGAGAWVEEGQGSLKMYASAQTGRYRMVMTKDSSSSDASRKQLCVGREAAAERALLAPPLPRCPHSPPLPPSSPPHPAQPQPVCALGEHAHARGL